VGERWRAGGRRHPGDVDDVLDPDRDAVQGTDGSSRSTVVVPRPRFGERRPGVNRRPRADRGVRGGDPVEAPLDDLHRRHRPADLRVDHVHDAEAGDLGHRGHRPRSGRRIAGS
jgi:hypothetical protein